MRPSSARRNTPACNSAVTSNRLHIPPDTPRGLTDGYRPRPTKPLEQLPALGGQYSPEEFRRLETDASVTLCLTALGSAGDLATDVLQRLNFQYDGAH
jgi:hypothetical protein